MRKSHLLLAAGLAAAAFAGPAAAQFSPDLYFGFQAGRAHFTDVCTVATQCKNRDTDGGIFAGLQIGRYVAVEAVASYLGHAEVDGASVKANAIELDAVLTWPLYKGFSALGRVGAFHGVMKSAGKSVNKNGVTYGWGGQYDFDPKFAMRLEYQRHPDLGGGDFGATTHIDTINLGALFRFQ
jgi:opacity protein-like surface antigen